MDWKPLYRHLEDEATVGGLVSRLYLGSEENPDTIKEMEEWEVTFKTWREAVYEALIKRLIMGGVNMNLKGFEEDEQDDE